MEDAFENVRDMFSKKKNWKEQTTGLCPGVGNSIGTNFLNKETGELISINCEYPGGQTYPDDEELDEMGREEDFDLYRFEDEGDDADNADRKHS